VEEPRLTHRRFSQPLPTATLEDDQRAELRGAIDEAVRAADYPASARSYEGLDSHDVALWSTLGTEMGLAGVGLPESFGGLGGISEVLVVAEELGASLAAVPYIASTVLSGQVLAAAGDVAGAWVQRIAAGEVIAPAILDQQGVVAEEGGPCVFDPASCTINGVAPFVAHGVHASGWLVAARSDQGPVLAVVEAGGPGVTPITMRTLDFTWPMAQVEFVEAPVSVVAEGDIARKALWHGEAVGVLAIAADQLGGAQRAFDLTLEYIKIRRQFNREIGSFQAIKHRMADALSLVEMSRSAIERIAWTSPEERAQTLSTDASIAKVWCSSAYVDVVAEMIQLHGGVGFTWEHDAHLYFRRARFDAAYLGDAQMHRARLAEAW
jgi:alkylation response protein AidB-like acyl-CoA dehydrogenase